MITATCPQCGNSMARESKYSAACPCGFRADGFLVSGAPEDVIEKINEAATFLGIKATFKLVKLKDGVSYGLSPASETPIQITVEQARAFFQMIGASQHMLDQLPKETMH